MTEQVVRCAVLVIGGGLAALTAALEARKLVDDVVLVSKRKAGRSGNVIVSGAAFSASVPSEEPADSLDQHLKDTLEGGDGVNDPDLARILASEAPERVIGLEQYGVGFLRAEGSLIRRTPPGHRRPRSIPTNTAGCTHATRGLSITLPLLSSAEVRGIRILSSLPVHRLLARDGAVFGAVALDPRSGDQIALLARAVVLAAGGGGQLFDNTNNTADMTGDSYAMALETGVPLRDMEFVQFYPTMMSYPAHVTISSPLFGEGAVLRNRHGERFMPRYDPANADMATRDIMSRAIFHEVRSGNGVDGGVYMDCSAIPETTLERKFPTLIQLMRAHSIDLSKRWLVASPATHFLMGGAWIDRDCRTNVEGLFAAGEAAGGVHGANRLSGNALSEAVVFGSRAGHEAASYAARASGAAPSPSLTPLPAPRSGGLELGEVKTQLRRAMWEHGSIIRTEEGMRTALERLKECLEVLPRCALAGPADVAALLEIERMAWVGRCIITAALERRESRGAHFRDDYRERDDTRWLGTTRIVRDGEGLKVEFVPLPPSATAGS